jgi:hypothetical protein
MFKMEISEDSESPSARNQINQQLRNLASDAIDRVFEDSPESEKTSDPTQSLGHFLEANSSLPFAVHLRLDLFKKDMNQINVRFSRDIFEATADEVINPELLLTMAEATPDSLPELMKSMFED